MKRLIFFILPVLFVFPLCVAQENPQVAGDFRDFGISNQDTVLVMDCSEWAIDRLNPLFFADYRNELTISFNVVFHTFNTEQAVLCRESRQGNMIGDLTIGYDPGCNRIFAEVITDSSQPHRVWAGPAIESGKRYQVKLNSRLIDGSVESSRPVSVLELLVTADDSASQAIHESIDRSITEYAGYPLPYYPGRWILGHGYPAGCTNSLQARNVEVSDLVISGKGLPHIKGANPLFTDRFTADPACTVVGDRLYAYVGEDCATPGGWFDMPHWVAYSTRDMIDWECHGPVLKAGDFPNANPHGAWAGQVVENDGKFYFYVTLDDVRNGRHMICVAIGDNPLGPFKPSPDPIITDDLTPSSHRPNADIDPTVFIDDDGTAWIAWGNGDCYLARLDKSLTAIEGEIKHVGLRNYSEGPWLFKRGDFYYLVYAADAPGVQPEQLAYSMATSLDGDWTYGGLLTGPARYGFTIHPSVNEFNGSWYLFYHDGCYMLDGTPGGDCRRHVCAEHLYFNPDGTIQPIILTHQGISK